MSGDAVRRETVSGRSCEEGRWDAVRREAVSGKRL